MTQGRLGARVGAGEGVELCPTLDSGGVPPEQHADRDSDVDRQADHQDRPDRFLHLNAPGGGVGVDELVRDHVDGDRDGRNEADEQARRRHEHVALDGVVEQDGEHHDEDHTGRGREFTRLRPLRERRLLLIEGVREVVAHGRNRVQQHAGHVDRDGQHERGATDHVEEVTLLTLPEQNRRDNHPDHRDDEREGHRAGEDAVEGVVVENVEIHGDSSKNCLNHG